MSSARRSIRRTTIDEHVASLHARPTTRRLIVVDNTATSGATLRAVIDRLHSERVIVTAAATASISRHLTPPAPHARRGDPA